MTSQPGAQEFKPKVGDWVRVVGSDIVGRVTGEDASAVHIDRIDGGKGFHAPHRLRPWQPQPGERCEGVGAGDGVTPISGRFVRLLPAGSSWFLRDSAELQPEGIPYKLCITLESLRPASPPAESRAEMPEDVREPLAEARKRNPHAVIARIEGKSFVFVNGTGSGLEFGHVSWKDHGDYIRDHMSMGGFAGQAGYGNGAVADLRNAIAAGTAWPLEDAKKLVEPGKSPPAFHCASCMNPVASDGADCASCWVQRNTRKPDPYVIVRERHDYVNEYAEAGDKRTRETRIAAMSTDHPLSRLAARKQRQRAEVLADISRPRTYRDRMGRTVDWYGKRK